LLSRYLHSNRKKLEDRKQTGIWFGFSAARNLNLHDRADFLVPLLADRGLCAPLPRPAAQYCVMASAGFSVRLAESSKVHHPLYVLGLVNSKLLFWNLMLISNKFRGGWITCTKQYFGTLPTRTIEASDKPPRAVHDQVVKRVESMLELGQRLAKAKTDHEKESFQRELTATDRQIDQLVYELYGLTEEEIRIVEETTA
jgi:hypothetical protein